jgi:hypothetical protein
MKLPVSTHGLVLDQLSNSATSPSLLTTGYGGANNISEPG